ncbi:GEVED domain-containing protein [Nostoc sp. NIES-2111]
MPADGHLVGNLQNYSNQAQDYSTGSDFFTFDGPESVYKIPLPRPNSRILARSNANPNYYTGYSRLVVDETGETDHTLAVNGNWDFQSLSASVAGSSAYLVIEQATTSLSPESYDIDVAVVCNPGVNTYPSHYLSSFTLNNQTNYLDDYYLTISGYTFYSPVWQPSLGLNIGTNNAIDRVNNRDAYCNMYIDFNRDGDFDDPSEAIYIQSSAQRSVKHNLILPETNPVYFGALGKKLVMRIITSASPITGGPCDYHSAASIVDVFVKIGDTYPAAKAVDFQWVRIANDANDDRFVRVRNAPDSGLYTAGCHISNSIDYHNFQHPARLYSFQQEGLPGQLANFQGRTYHNIERQGVVSRYGRNGSLIWTAHFQPDGTFPNSPGKVDVTGLSLDPAGYLYAAGTFTNSLSILFPGGQVDSLLSAGGTDGFVAKFYPDGRLVYAFRYGGPGEDASTSIEADSAGVYLSGSFSQTMDMAGLSGPSATLTSRGSIDAFLAAFSDSGVFRWAVQVGGPRRDVGTGVGLNRQGSPYLSGEYRDSVRFTSTLSADSSLSRKSLGGTDGFVLALSDSGQIRWISSFGGPGDEILRDIAPDPSGTGVVAVGAFRQTATFGDTTLTSHGLADAFALRLSDSGRVDWVSYGGGSGEDIAYGVRLDHAGNPWVALTIQGSVPSLFGSAGMQALGGNDGALLQLDAASGQSLHPELIASIAGSSDDQALGIDTADGGGALVAGYTSGSNFGRLGYFRNMHYILPNAFIARYSAPIIPCLLTQPHLVTNSPLCLGDTLNLYGTGIDPLGTVRLTGPAGFSISADSGRIPALTPSVAGIYSLTVTSRVQLCSASDSSRVVVNPLPVAPVTVADSVCGSGTGRLTTLNPAPGDTTYWYDSARAALLFVGPSFTTPVLTASATYYTSYVSAQGCRSDTLPVQVQVNPLPTVAVSASGPTRFCQGDSVFVRTDGTPDVRYQFYRNGIPLTGATTGSLVVHDSGQYAVIVQTRFGCADTSNILPVTVDPTPPVPSITTQIQGGGIRLVSSAPTGNQWYRDGNPVSSATDPTLLVNNPADNGTYTCQVTLGPCSSAISAGTVVTIVGLTGKLGSLGLHLTLNPNPAKGLTYLSLTGLPPDEPLHLQLSDALGRRCLSTRLTTAEAAQAYPLYLDTLPKGVYTLQILTRHGLLTRRLEIE